MIYVGSGELAGSSQSKSESPSRGSAGVVAMTDWNVPKPTKVDVSTENRETYLGIVKKQLPHKTVRSWSERSGNVHPLTLKN
jgi:hypothetical protein